jgi:hypothetical protein
MQDPHVESLRYRLEAAEDVTFLDPPAVSWDLGSLCRIALVRETATIGLIEHFATEGEARHAVEPFLRAWEIDAGLKARQREFTFAFLGSSVIDRNPLPGHHERTASTSVRSSAAVSRTVGRSSYPPPPGRFAVSPAVETMWERYCGFRDGHEPLTSMAYLCLTVLEASAGGLRKAAMHYRVDVSILSKLGYLTSKVGDDITARKLDGLAERRPHTGAEQAWMEAAILGLIQRLAEYSFDATQDFRQLRMADLPCL